MSRESGCRFFDKNSTARIIGYAARFQSTAQRISSFYWSTTLFILIVGRELPRNEKSNGSYVP